MGIVSLDPATAGDCRAGAWLQSLFTGLCTRPPSSVFVTSSGCSRLCGPWEGSQTEGIFPAFSCRTCNSWESCHSGK